MRVVLDTNTVVSGLLWSGPPSRLLHAARSGAAQLFTSAAMLMELDDVVRRPRFAKRIALAQTTPADLIHGFASLANLIEALPIETVVTADPDDDVVLACADAADAESIVSGDHHLLALGNYKGIPIMTASEMLSRLNLT